MKLHFKISLFQVWMRLTQRFSIYILSCLTTSCPHNITYIGKHQDFDENQVFWYHFEKSFFFSISPKISKFKEKVVLFRSLWKNIFFCLYVQKINISRKIAIFRDHFEKLVFCPCQKYQHFQKKMLSSLLKNSVISENIKISRKKYIFLDKQSKLGFRDYPLSRRFYF